MDFAKAFDKVPHKKLIRKLKEYGNSLRKENLSSIQLFT